jgi:hypothetical protein
MMDERYFTDKMQEAFKLMGINSKAMVEMAQAIFPKIKWNYSNEDFNLAIDSVLGGEYTKLTYPILIKHLNSHRSARYDRESRLQQERDRQHMLLPWEHKHGDEVCEDHKCASCLKEKYIHCKTVAMATCQAIRKMYPDATATTSNARAKLSIEFPGFGFEKVFERSNGITTMDLQAYLRAGRLHNPIADEPISEDTHHWENG